jgi:DNA polymerase
LRVGGKKKKRASKTNANSAAVSPGKPPSQKKPKVRSIRRRRPEGELVLSPRRTSPIPVFSGGGDLYGRAFYALDAPGMPLPGADFLDLASAMGDTTQMVGKSGTKNWGFVEVDGQRQIGGLLERLYCEALYSKGTFVLPMTVRGGLKREMAVVAGHPWSRRDARHAGPGPNNVFVLGKCLGEEERRSGSSYVGPTGELLYETCQMLGINPSTWYMTNVLKTEQPEDRSGELKKPWVREFLPLLHQELKIVRPKYILCLGADASKTLLGRDFSIKTMEGRVVEYTYPVHSDGCEEEMHTALVMSIVHPAFVLRQPESTDKFESGLARFGQLVSGLRWDREEHGLDHFNIDTLDGLLELERRIKRECEGNLLAVDAEWHGDHPQNSNAYVRTVQLSWKDKTAACVILRGQGGALRMRCEGEDPREDHQSTAVHILNRICEGKRIAGHFLNSDLEWLVPLGLDLRPQFSVPDSWQETMAKAIMSKEGGFDTGIACHAVNETGDFALTSMGLRFTSAPRYDSVLTKWKRDYCRTNKLKAEDLEGFGECPDEILHPEPDHENPNYACYDADVTRRMVAPLQRLLCSDHFGNNSWEAFWMTMRALPGILEMNTTGIPVDHDRLDALTDMYMTSRARLEREIREWARWPELNLNSVFQVREFLFGEELNGKERAPDDPPIRLRPPGARSLRLQPVLTTDKHPKRWDQLGWQEMLEKTPSTDKMSLSILAQESQAVRRAFRRKSDGQEVMRVVDYSGHVNKLRDFRFISQVLKSTLRPPVVTEDKSEFVRTEDGHYIYPGGLPASVCGDGRVRSHGYPTKETGRWSFSRPAMQNFAKRRETDYKRILKESYRWPLRTIMKAPEGYCLVESDYKGAELFGMAMMADDQAMLEHAQKNLLPEYHPDFYDIHSSVAVSAFGYDCEPTKAGLKRIGKKHMRIVAKSVIFGIAYGRGAKGIVLAAKEEGVHITQDEAQQVIDAIFGMYPDLLPFFAECRERSADPRWLCSAFGRFRRFPVARDYAVQGEFERQAMNFPIQGVVADAVARAVDYLYNYRTQVDDSVLYRLALQIHDAVLLLVPYKHVPAVVDEVMPYCMTDMVPIYPCYLDGMPQEAGPYHLGIDTEVMLHWGEKLSPGQCLDLGFSPRYGGWIDTSLGWIDPENESKIWRNDGFIKPGDGEFDRALQDAALRL